MSGRPGKALPIVRRFLVGHRVTWTNLVNGEGAAISRRRIASRGPRQFPRRPRRQDRRRRTRWRALEQAVIRRPGRPAAVTYRSRRFRHDRPPTMGDHRFGRDTRLMPVACGVARAQFVGEGASSVRSATVRVTAISRTGLQSYGSYGYGVRTGQVGAGYRGAGQLYPPASGVGRPQTTSRSGRSYSAITSVPGWNGPSTTHRARRRVRTTLPVARRPSR